MQKNSWTSDYDARWKELVAPFVREKLVAIGVWPTHCEYAKVTQDPRSVQIDGGTSADHESSRRDAFNRITSGVKVCIVPTTPCDIYGNLSAYLRFEIGDEREDIWFRWQISPKGNEDDDRKGKFSSFADIHPLYRGVQFDKDLKKELNTIARSKKREEKLFATAGREKLEKQQLSSSLLAMKGKKRKI